MATGSELEAAASYEGAIGVFMAAFADAAVRVADPVPGAVALDLACGTGLVARRLLPLVGPGGRVVGCDPDPGMLAVARSACPAEVGWVVAPAEALPFPDGAFDLVCCQQGVQFFGDRAGAFAEIRRVLRPGGRLVATVWATAHCPYLLAQAVALEAEAGPAAVASLWTALPARGDVVLEEAAGGAGFAAVDVREVATTAELPALDAYLPAQLAATPWGAPFAALDAGGRHRVVDAVRLRLTDHRGVDGLLRVPFASYLLVADA